jgi:xanthine dehydrogenase accessory factor
MRDWARRSSALIDQGQDVALITLLAVEGSTPREAGTKMLVGRQDAWGTVGGGALEHQVMDQARRMLDRDSGPRLAIQDYPLGPLLAQCCGGRVRLMIERLGGADRSWLAAAAALQAANTPFETRARVTAGGLVKSVQPVAAAGNGLITVNARPALARGPAPGDGDILVETAAPLLPTITMFGAGHVGVAVARTMAPLPFRMRWCDSRPDVAPHPGLTVHPPPELLEIAGQPADFMLILTHDHALDYSLVLAALSGAKTGYVGLIGSRTKRARFIRRLDADGLSQLALARLVCPKGLPQLRDKAPEVIAVSVAADLLVRWRARQALAVPELAVASL